jgi:hypothetical protein
MSTTLRAPRQAPAFAAAWVEPPNAVHPTGTVKVCQGKTWDYYDVTEIECQFEGCRGFRLVKHDPGRTEHYAALSANGQDCWCDCRAFEKSGCCRHLRALREVLTNA